MGVSAIRRVRGRGGHRASRSGRRASNASKSQTKTARSRSIWDDVPLGERVEGSPSRRPVRVRDAVQVALYAGQERRGVRGVAHRARPPARDPKLPARRTSPIGNNEVPRRLVAKKAFPRAEVWKRAKSVGASARAPSADPLLDARGTRGRIAARARRARIGPRRERRFSAVSYRRTRRGRLREIVDER